MKRNDRQAAREKKIEELQKDLTVKEQELMRVRIEMLSGTVKNTHAAKAIRKQIVQLKTLIFERALHDTA